ncbi:MAG: hypothetical protein ACWA5T_04935 [Parvularcula sp.]
MISAFFTSLSLVALSSSAAIQVEGAPAAPRTVSQTAIGPVSNDAMEQRLERIETALRDLQGTVYSVEQPRAPVPVRAEGAAVQVVPVAAQGTQPAVPVSEADLSVRITALEQSLAALTGEVERLNYKLDQQGRILDQMRAKDGLADGVGPAASGADDMDEPAPDSDPVQSGQPMDLATGEVAEPVSLPDDPDAAYDEAYQAVLAADFDAAEQKLSAYVEKFPAAPQTADAKFLLGEVYLATGANGDAARVFLDHVGTYKDDPRAPEAYLKLGMSFSRLDRRDEACKVLNVGKAKFANMSDGLRRRYDEERAAANCR